MIKSATFTIAFIWSVARGMTQRLSLFSLLLLRSRNVKLEIIVPVKREISYGGKTIHLYDHIREKRKDKDLERVQPVKLSVLKELSPARLFLN